MNRSAIRDGTRNCRRIPLAGRSVLKIDIFGNSIERALFDRLRMTILDDKCEPWIGFGRWDGGVVIYFDRLAEIVIAGAPGRPIVSVIDHPIIRARHGPNAIISEAHIDGEIPVSIFKIGRAL